MTDYRDDLIRVFTSDSVDRVIKTKEYRQLCTAHDGDLQFNAERALVERAKKRLESLLDKPFPRAEQVRAALTELHKKRSDRHQGLYYDLIVAGYEFKWSDTQKDYFRRAWRLIQSKYDFFFSFTTRHQPPDEDNLVNTDYRHFISVYADANLLHTADRRRTNLLAHAIYRLLAKDRNGFLFTRYEGENQMVEERLRTACQSSLVFVQLVQNIMFRPSGERPNYCFFEYNEATSWILPDLNGEERVLFIVAEDSPEALTDPDEVPEEYEGWYKHLRAKGPPYLKRFGIYDEAKIEEYRNSIEEKIAARLRAAWQRIFLGVPN
jgi:hypothetical protein